MKNYYTIKIFLIMLFLGSLGSCSSVFSPVGDKTTNLNTGCDNCSNTRKYFKSYGEAEIISGPRVKMQAISQARTFARNELVKQIGTEGMSIAAQISQTVTEGQNQTFKENLTSGFKEQAYAMLENTEDDCLETKLVRKRKKGGEEWVVATVCIKMSKKEFANNVYRENKKMLSGAKIDYEKFEIMLSGEVVDK